MTVITVSIEIKTVFALLVILVVEDAQGLMKGNALNVQMLATHSLMENVRERILAQKVYFWNKDIVCLAQLIAKGVLVKLFAKHALTVLLKQN